MKNLDKFISVCSLAFMATTLVACGGSTTKIDKTKTQVYVYSWGGGYREEWLYNAAERYEDKVKEVSYEEGKKGVQIIISADKNNEAMNNIASFSSNKNEIFFTEGVPYASFSSTGALLDLTDVVTTESAYDGKTIESKLNDDYRNYLNRDGHYYALPHYPGFYGFAYSIEIFDKIEAYIDVDGGIVGQSHKAKGLGPNGKTGVISGVDYSFDDGLPATYDQFFDLCGYIRAKGYYPVHWTGKHVEMHMNALFRSLVADADGAEVTKMRSSFNGDPMVLKLDSNKQPVFDEEGNLELEQAHIRNENGSRKDMYRTPGLYYAADFMRRLNDLPHSSEADNSTVTHLDAQSHFIFSNTELAPTDDNGRTANYAMLIDGPWWESEGREFFKEAQERLKDDKYSRANRKFGWLPLPKPTEELVGQGNALADHLESFVVAKKSNDDVKNNLLKDFIAFVNSDEELVNFALDTGVKKCLNYEIPQDKLGGLSSYAKSLLNYVSTTEVIYPGVQNPYYEEHRTEFNSYTSLKSQYQANIRGTVYGAGHAFYMVKDLSPEEWISILYNSKVASNL